MVNRDAGYGQDYDPRPPEGLVLPPWEDRRRYGALNGFYLTVKDVLLIPGRFFGRMPTRIGLVQPLLFAVIMGVIAAFFHWMWTLAGSSLQILVKDNLAEVLRGPLVSAVLFVLSPVTAAVSLVVAAGLLHLGLIICGGNRLGFEATFRVAAYAEAASILSILPFCGVVLGTLYGLAVTVVGLHRVHDIDPWRALLALLLPLVLCLASCGGLALVTSSWNALLG
jgi:hypothetical protein